MIYTPTPHKNHMENHGIRAISTWDITVRDQYGRIKQHLPLIPNIITDKGIEDMAKSIIGAGSPATHHAIGTGSREPSPTDTALQTEVSRKSIGTRTSSGGITRLSTPFIHSGTDYDITEVGVFTASSGGICLMRVTTNTPALFRASDPLAVTQTISFARDES